MIDEAKLIEEMAEEIENLYGKETELSQKAREYLEQLKCGGWIFCKDKLPDNTEDDSIQYLITVKVGKDEYEIDFGWWSKISKYDNSKKKWVDYFGWTVGNDWDEGQGMEVIAWQPLPEPYKGE